MNVLFLTDPAPNYVPDLLLHGFRKLIGPAAVDYPRKNCLYEGFLGGAGGDQLCPGWFPPDGDGGNRVDRDDIRSKILRGFFKYIICDVRAYPVLQRLILEWPSGLVLVDGEDFPVRIPPGRHAVCRRETDGSDFSIPLPMALPEEIFRWIASYDGEGKRYSVGFLGGASDVRGERRAVVEAVARAYPDSLLQTTGMPSEENPNPDGRLGRDDYYRSLQKCRVVLSLPGTGFDTFRFWENAAMRAVHISRRLPLLIPGDFREGWQILRFSTPDELRRAIDFALEDDSRAGRMVEGSRRSLLERHLTTRRAVYLLQRLESLFG